MPSTSNLTPSATTLPPTRLGESLSPGNSGVAIRPPSQASAESPAIDVSIARQILSDSASLARETATNSQPLALVDVVTQVADPERRKSAIKSYWQLSAATLDLAHAKREFQELQALPAPADRAQQAELAAAQAIARARVGETELAVRTLQADLEESGAVGWQIQSPLPIDIPFIGRYRTNLETYAASDRVPPGLKRIDRSLPWILETLVARSEAIDALQFQWNEMIQSYRSGRVPLSQLLEQHEKLCDQRLEFLAGVRDYNQLIAEYALSVAPPQLSPEAVVGMLLREPSPAVARALPSQRLEQGTPTNSEGWRSVPR